MSFHGDMQQVSICIDTLIMSMEQVKIQTLNWLIAYPCVRNNYPLVIDTKDFLFLA